MVDSPYWDLYITSLFWNGDEFSNFLIELLELFALVLILWSLSKDTKLFFMLSKETKFLSKETKFV